MTHDDLCKVGCKYRIEKQAEEEGVSLKQAIKDWAKEHNVPTTTVEAWVYLKKEHGKPCTPKPIRKQTKPETKIQLEEITKEIEANNIADDDLKPIHDATAKKVKEGKVAPHVASKLVTAAKERRRDRSKYPKEEIPSEVKRLSRKLDDCSEQLQLLAEGTLKVTSGDQIYLKSIRAKGLSFIWSFHDMGIDIPKVYRFIVGRKELGDGKEAAIETEAFDVVEAEGEVIN
jgi:hypothetical protein